MRCKRCQAVSACFQTKLSWQHPSKTRLPPGSTPTSMQPADSPVSIQLRAVLVAVFQKRMQRSAVPPPEARRPCWWGDHAMACNRAHLAMWTHAQQAVGFTAALRRFTDCCSHAAAANANHKQTLETDAGDAASSLHNRPCMLTTHSNRQPSPQLTSMFQPRLTQR